MQMTIRICKWQPTVNCVATNVKSVAAVNSVAGFSAEQKATELTVESISFFQFRGRLYQSDYRQNEIESDIRAQDR